MGSLGVTYAATTVPVAIQSLKADRTSPQAVGTNVTWACNATGGTSLQYKFWTYTVASGWQVVRDYSTSKTFAWAPSGAVDYTICVWVKDAASSAAYDKLATAGFTVGTTPVSVAVPTPTPVPTGSNNVKDYGAQGNGVTVDNAAIQKAIDAVNAKGGGTVSIPDGTYLIDLSSGVGLNLKSNVTLNLSANAILKAKSTSLDKYRIIEIRDAFNVGIIGGKIIGDVDSRSSSGGGNGHGIAILSSNNVHIADISISKCWGDGIYLGVSTSKNYSSDVLIERFNISYCRRSDMSVISAKNLTVQNGTLTYAGGMTNAGCGINFEPNETSQFLQNIQVNNVTTSTCAMKGFKTSFAAYAKTTNPVSITATNYAGNFNNWVTQYGIVNHGIMVKINGVTYSN